MAAAIRIDLFAPVFRRRSPLKGGASRAGCISEKLTSSSIVMLYRSDARNEKLQSHFIDYVRAYSSEAD